MNKKVDLEAFLSDAKSRFKQTKNKMRATISNPEMWISPNIHAFLTKFMGLPRSVIDSLSSLFEAGALWQTVKAKTHVFLFYLNGAIDNTPPNLMRQIVNVLEEANISIALEVMPINNLETGYCGKDAAEIELKKMNLITKAGGEIAYLALDNPFYKKFEVMHPPPSLITAPPLPHEAVEEVTHEIIDYIKAIRKVYPDIKIGEIDAVPWYTVGEYSADQMLRTVGDLPKILDYLFRGLEEVGEKMDFFHADNPYDCAMRHPSDGWSKLKAIEDFVKTRGVKFGLIYHTMRGGETSDELYFKETIEDLIKYAEAGGNPDHMAIRSWYKHPAYLIPETQPYTFTYLVKEFLEILEDP